MKESRFYIKLKRSVCFCFFVCVFFLIHSQLLAQSIQSSSDNKDQLKLVSNDPPTNPKSERPEEVGSFLTSEEFALSLMVLSFGIVVFLFLFLLVRSKLFSSSQALIAFTVTLVITASLFLISAGFSSQQITPIIGLLGTIIGYLLGSNKNNNEQ